MIINTIANSQLHIGFTGTRNGMTDRQKAGLERRLKFIAKRNPNTDLVFHHGDCIGADAEAHEIAEQVGYHIVIHPPDNPKHRAYCHLLGELPGQTILVLSEKPYLVRNKDIVDDSHLLLAAPRLNTKESRSGTWMTIDYSRATGRLWKILRPNKYI